MPTTPSGPGAERLAAIDAELGELLEGGVTVQQIDGPIIVRSEDHGKRDRVIALLTEAGVPHVGPAYEQKTKPIRKR